MDKIIDERFIEFVKKSRCCVTHEYGNENENVVPSHQNVPIPCRAKGTGQKNHDIWALPVKHFIHTEEHQGLFVIENNVQKIVLNIKKYLYENPSLGSCRLATICEMEKEMSSEGVLSLITEHWKDNGDWWTDQKWKKIF